MFSQILARNAGLDGASIATKGVLLHQDPSHQHYGVDLAQGLLRDMAYVEPRVLEPARLPQCMVEAAVALAGQVLRIDENVLMQPRAQFVVPSA